MGWGVPLVCLLLTLGLIVGTPRSAAGKRRADLDHRSLQEGVASSLRFSHRTHYDHAVACERCHVPGPDPAKVPPLPGGWLPLEPSRIIHGPSITIDDEGPGPIELPSGPASGTASATPFQPPPPPTFGRPPEKTCMQCHFRQRRNQECGLCHLGPPGPTVRKRVRLTPPTRFPHEAHTKIDCLDCHPKVSDWETLDGCMQDRSMEGCVTCHNGVKAKKSCTMCHDPTPRPRDHVRNFENKHGLVYRADPHSCRACHEDSSCVACHSQKPRSHTLAWVSRRHGLTAMGNPDSCKACHTDPHVCMRCHDEWKSP